MSQHTSVYLLNFQVFLRLTTDALLPRNVAAAIHIETMGDVQRLRSLVGPCPREIVRYVECAEDYTETVEHAASVLKDVRTITDFLRTPCSFLPESSLRLFLMDRDGLLDKQNLLNDDYSTSVKGDIALEAMKDRLLKLSAADAHHLFTSFGGVLPHGL